MAQPPAIAAVRATCRKYLDAYASFVHGYRPEWHHKVWCDRIQAVVEGRTKKRKLLILSPPGHAKSVYCSTILPTWYLGNNPDHYLLHFTSSDDNAYAQLNTIKLCLDGNEKHQLVFPDDRCRPNKERGWSQIGLYLNGTPPSERHPAYRGLGMTTAFIGARAHGIIIDDPMSQEDARSEIEQIKAKARYAEEIVPRLIPHTGWIVAVATRWHELDLPGYWIDKMEKGEEDWDVLSLPAIAEDDVDYGGPAPGVYPHGDKALWPKRFPMDWLLAEQKRLTAPIFACQYLNNPTSLGGDVFRNAAWFKDLPLDFNVPGRDGRRFADTLTIVQFWDLAFSSKTSADWTVAVTMGKDVDGRLYLLDVWRARVAELVDKTEDDEHGLAAHIAAHIARVQPHVVGVESNAYQNATTRSLIHRVSQILVRKNVATTVRGIKVAADKVTRAFLPASVAERGDLFVDKRAHWWAPFIKEVMGFPNAAHDDMVDGLSGATQLAIEGIASGALTHTDYAHKAPEDPASHGWSPFDVLDDAYAKAERERIARVIERTRSLRPLNPHVVPR